MILTRDHRRVCILRVWRGLDRYRRGTSLLSGADSMLEDYGTEFRLKFRVVREELSTWPSPSGELLSSSMAVFGTGAQPMVQAPGQTVSGGAGSCSATSIVTPRRTSFCRQKDGRLSAFGSTRTSSAPLLVCQVRWPSLDTRDADAFVRVINKPARTARGRRVLMGITEKPLATDHGLLGRHFSQAALA